MFLLLHRVKYRKKGTVGYRYRFKCERYPTLMLPLGNIIRKYRISFHCYADDSQLYISTRPDETSKLSKLTECVKNVKDWMTNNFLLLNLDQTEILLIGPKKTEVHRIS